MTRWAKRSLVRLRATGTSGGRSPGCTEPPSGSPADLRREGGTVEAGGVYFDESGTADLIRAMQRLSPSQRAAVFLHYQADLPVREVARLMGTSAAAVKVHLHRGRNHLRELLGTEEVDDA